MRPIFHRVEQRSPEWHAIRRSGIGASDIAVITGDAPWGDVRTLYQEKLDLAARPVENRRMEAGRRFEDVVRRWYAEDEKRPTRAVHGIYRHPEIPYVIASLDGLTVRAPRRVVEVKVTEGGDEWGEPGTDQVPDHYREQLEWEMLAAGVDVADLAAFFIRERRLKVYTAHRDQALSDVLLGYAADFWACVTNRTPPSPGSRTLRVVQLRADEVEPDDELVALVALHAQAKGIADSATAELEAVKDRLRARLEDAGGSRGLLADGRRFSVSHRWAKDGRATHWELLVNELGARLRDVGMPDEELAALIEDYTDVTPGARSLRVSVQKEKRTAA